MKPLKRQKAVEVEPQKRIPHEGMPPLDTSDPVISFFEFWPAWKFYGPLALYCLWLSIRYRGLMLPTAVNPTFDNGGVVGESKVGILDLISSGEAAKFVPPYVPVHRTDIDFTYGAALSLMKEKGLGFPLVAKPDNACRGAGVQLLKAEENLKKYIRDFPENETFILQELVDYECEAGIFYIRDPDQKNGRVTSLTLKYFPYVYGDGRSTLRDLILADKRAGQVPHLYLSRHRERLDEVIPDGKPVRLAFSGTHSKGTIFKDGQAFITDEMHALFDKISKAIPEFYFGRIDVRFQSMRDLETGDNMKIMEINGATGEMTHVWDSKTTLRKAYKDLMFQYKKLYEIGRKNKDRGFKVTSLSELWKEYKKYDSVINIYPETH